MNRRLTAIVVADVVGYSRLMEADEAGTLGALKARRKATVEPLVKEHHGRIVKVMGDGVLIEFASVVNAVACALALQGRMAEANAGLAEPQRIILRIGINSGDVIGEGADIYGDGVNIAARLEALAEPGGICISAKVQDEIQGKLDCIAVEAGEVTVKNISRPIRIYRLLAPGAARPTSQSPAPTTLRSVAVLPFNNLSGDPTQQYLSDGITEDILTALSRFKGIAVMARHGSFQLARSTAGPLQAAKALGIGHVVEGSVRRAGKGLRITVQLIDTVSGNHLWAERYDVASEEIFAVQDEVVAAIAATLEGRIASAGAAATRAKPTESWSAYDFVLRGRELINAGDDAGAVALFQRATELDPEFASAHAWLGLTHALLFSFDADSARLDIGARAVQRALLLDHGDPLVHWATALVFAFQRQQDKAMRHIERAVALNPSDTSILADRAFLLQFSDRFEEALAQIDDVIRRDLLSPPWFWLIRATALFHLGRYEEVVEALDRLTPKNYPTQLYAVAALIQVGRAADAAALLAEVRHQKPQMRLSEFAAVLPYANPRRLDRLLESLRRAGLPD